MLSRHLWETGERDESEGALHRTLRDTVSRALNDGPISAPTLQLFIAGFSMLTEHERHLWRRYAEDEPDRGSGAATERDPAAAARAPVPRSSYRTISVTERHLIGADGLPVEHETAQVVEAIEPLERFSFIFDTDSASVQVLHGGTASASYPTDRPGLYAVDIQLPEPCLPGRTASVGYRSIFHYWVAPPREFRRMLRRDIRSALIQVQFHPDRVPTSVSWSTWSALDADPTSTESAQLGADLGVHRYLTDDQIRDEIVGFTWEW